jgi:hypothetical protein
VIANLSWSEIIRSHPIGNRFYGFRAKYSSHWKDKVDSNNDREGNAHLSTCREKLLNSDRLKTSSPRFVSHLAKS